MAFTDGNIVIGTSVDVGGLNSGLRRIEKSFKKLAATTLGITGLAALAKQAIDAASNLQEVQNIVDVTFTELDAAGDVVADMRYKIEEFADTCITKFGMSEFAAKQTAGSFMAMGKAMGFNIDTASDMAVQLTALTGDFASFYNISQDYARVALSAVYTGETETLKRYGIILTEANLQEYATAQGIETTVKKMSAREKAMLRYNYIMEATKAAQGDFVRTQDSWANSTRVLSQLWNEFLVELGSGLISVLSPMVVVLGQIVQRLTAFVKTLWQILSNIFGFKLQNITEEVGSAGGAVGGLADETDDLGDSIEKAGKKAKKQLGNFDELNNILTTDTSGSGTASALGGLSDMDLGGVGQDLFENPEDWADIDSLRGLGKWLGDKLCAMMESIDWDKVYEGARNFGKGFADFLNGLFVDTDLFKDLGHTIAGSLNAVIYAALAFAETFEWDKVGKKLAAGVNEFFTTFDFASCAEAINKWVQGIWDLIVNFFAELSWDDIKQGFSDFFSNIDIDTVKIIAGFVILGQSLKALSRLVTTLGSTWSETFGGIILVIAGIVLIVKSFISIWTDGITGIKVALVALGVVLVTIGLYVAGLTAVASVTIGAILGVIAAIALIAIAIYQNWDEIKAWWQNTVVTQFKALWNSMKTTASQALNDMKTLVLTVWNNIKLGFTEGFNSIKAIFTSIKTTIISIIQSIATGSTAPLSNIKTSWINCFNTIKSSVVNIVQGMWSGIRTVINTIISGIQTMANSVINGINSVIRALNSIPKLNISIPTVGTISIPHLAKGAVIPPNKEFLAVLGDQKTGTNIEAPLDTIKQAFMETLNAANISGGHQSADSGDIVVQIDGYEVFRAVRKQNNLFKKSTGVNAF